MRQARILLVEDETDVLSLNQKHFEAQGYEVHCAKTLAEARAVIYEYPPDLILLDVLMPDGSGYDFCAELRKKTLVPILYLTCMGQDEDAIRGLMAGGDDYITKPYNLHVLSARVISALRRGGFPGAGRIEKPPLAIDLLSGRVTMGGKEFALTQKEMQILGYLVCYAGREISAESLSEALWRGHISPSAVRTHISNLRKKLLEVDGGKYFDISQSLGQGYMFTQIKYAEQYV
ncbi:response regulator transcription factor [Oscillospiraceae bacterium OttesenSCG-928-G22]|nr:response regulator transcription factor [Oscillospiraceae bacterium OttesenSCG-928-G22]